ncbi:MAG: hypothetical protein IJE01_01570 [Clostridia bacterium]|nr:hypothetical protein [Clostridia bacterium]
MANEQNLIPGGHKLTQEEQSAGGKKSGEMRRMRSAVKKILNGPIPKDMTTIRALLLEMGIEESSCYEGVSLAMVVNAMNGDKPSADWVRDTAGEKPKDEIEHSGGVVILSGDDDIAD